MRWKRSSSTRYEPATREDSSATTSALMWKSGSELKQRSSAVRSWCATTQRAVCRSLDCARRATLGGPGRPRRREHDAARGGGRCAPLGPRRGRRCQLVAARSSRSGGAGGGGRSASTTLRPRFWPARRPGRSDPRSGVAGSSGATQRPAATAPSTTAAQDSGSAIDTATRRARTSRARPRRRVATARAPAKLRTPIAARVLRVASDRRVRPPAAQTSAPRLSAIGAGSIREGGRTTSTRGRSIPGASSLERVAPFQYIIRGST